MAVRPWTVRRRYSTTCLAPASHPPPYVFYSPSFAVRTLFYTLNARAGIAFFELRLSAVKEELGVGQNL